MIDSDEDPPFVVLAPPPSVMYHPNYYPQVIIDFNIHLVGI